MMMPAALRVRGWLHIRQFQVLFLFHLSSWLLLLFCRAISEAEKIG
jgi:hypothetical protein